METKSKLNDLPASDDIFWEYAEVNSGLIIRDDPNEKHFFVRTTGRQAQCNLCDWGFELDPGDIIKEGHLYRKDMTLVI